MFYFLARVFMRIIAWIDLIIFTVVIYVVALFPRAWLRNFYQRFFRIWCRMFVRAFGVDLKLQQKNKKPFPKHYILIANHPSAFEDIGVPALFNVRTLAKIEVRHWPVVGRISRACGTIFVDRESKESRKQVIDVMKRILNEGYNIAIYPEGGCKGRRIFEVFRYGAFQLSMETGIPIVPVFLHYEAQQDFEWSVGETIFQKFWHFMTTKNNRATYYVFDAVDPSEFANKEEYAEYVYQEYLKWQNKYLE